MGSVVMLSVWDLDAGLPIDLEIEVGAHSTRHGVAVEMVRALGYDIKWHDTASGTPDDAELPGKGFEGWVTDSPQALRMILATWMDTNLAGQFCFDARERCVEWCGTKRKLRFALEVK